MKRIMNEIIILIFPRGKKEININARFNCFRYRFCIVPFDGPAKFIIIDKDHPFDVHQ